MRFPEYDSIFYKKSFDELDKQIKECFESELGPGDTPTKRRNQLVFGVIIPNSKYDDSGSCAAWAFKEIGESEFADTYIILSSNKESNICHVSTEDWGTPLGKIQVDKELAAVLINNFDHMKENNEAHRNRHEIEVQLPFLQFVSKDRLHDLKILPINMGNLTLEQVKELADLLESLERNICIIASSNLTKELIEAIKEKNSEKLDHEIPILTCLEIAKSFGFKYSRLLREYNKNDETYASFVLE